MKNEITCSYIVLFIRLFLALVLISTGYTMIFHAGPVEPGRPVSFISDYEAWPPDSQLWAQEWLGEGGNQVVLAIVGFVGMLVPWVFLIAGCLILAGLFTRWTSVALGITFIVILIGALLKNPMFDLSSHLFPYMAGLFLLLLLERMGNLFSVDAVFFRGHDREFESGGSWAALLARLMLGLYFLAGAYLKLAKIGLDEFVNGTFVEGYSQSWLPQFLLPIAGYFDVFAELIGGVLLLLGLLTSFATVVLALFMLMLALGHLIMEPFYSFTMHILPFFALLLFVFYLGRNGANRISLDHLFFRGRRH